MHLGKEQNMIQEVLILLQGKILWTPLLYVIIFVFYGLFEEYLYLAN